MDQRSKQDTDVPSTPAYERVKALNSIIAVTDSMTLEQLVRLNAIIPTLAQQLSRRTVYMTTSHTVITTGEDVTMDAILDRLSVRRSIATRIGRVVNLVPKEPIAKGSTSMSIATLFRRITTQHIFGELAAHGMVLASPLQLAAFVNVNAPLIGPYPLIAFGNIRIGRHIYPIPYSLHRDGKDRLCFEVHKPNFWLRVPRKQYQAEPIQLLIVPRRP